MSYAGIELKKNVCERKYIWQKKVNFYSISLWNDRGITNYPVSVFFATIETQLLGADQEYEITRVRRIGDKFIRIFSYYSTRNRSQIVIPFGKLKKNNPYWVNNEDRLEEIPIELYDINSLGYDLEYNVMMFTTNREGPSIQDVEEYLNTFIPGYTGLKVKIEPIMYNTGIEKVRNAYLVKSVTFSLDLGPTLNNFYNNEIQINQSRNLTAAFRMIAEAARDDGDSKRLSLTLGLGRRGKKGDTLNLESMLHLLDCINLDADCVSEITVNYKNGVDEKIDVARLKESNMLLSCSCPCRANQVSPEDLLLNLNNAVAEKVVTITHHNRDYFANTVVYDGENFNIIVVWNDDN